MLLDRSGGAEEEEEASLPLFARTPRPSPVGSKTLASPLRASGAGSAPALLEVIGVSSIPVSPLQPSRLVTTPLPLTVVPALPVGYGGLTTSVEPVSGGTKRNRSRARPLSLRSRLKLAARQAMPVRVGA